MVVFVVIDILKKETLHCQKRCISLHTVFLQSPMDLSTMMAKIDRHEYPTGAAFLSDVELICDNALEYNPDETNEDRGIRHRACTLKDVAHAIMSAGEAYEYRYVVQRWSSV